MINTSAFTNYQHHYPLELFAALQRLKKWQMPIFLAGGAVRDIILGIMPTDLDITVPGKALEVAKCFAADIGGVYVLLDEQQEVARVVWGDFCIDFSSFREATLTIEDDLLCRDFTINAMALPFNFKEGSFSGRDALIDPLNGENDLLQRKIIRSTSQEIFKKDPLRLLRAYRFQASLKLTIDVNVLEAIEREGLLLRQVAAERISHELDIIIGNAKSCFTFKDMAASGLFFVIFSELHNGKGVEQPGCHHLHGMQHNMETLARLEDILQTPERYFAEQQLLLERYFSKGPTREWLKWAALFHDAGTPASRKLRKNRVPFDLDATYGANIWKKIALRLKKSNRDTSQVYKLIRMHMWPVNLLTTLNKNGVTIESCFTLYKEAAGDLVGLFVLALADTLATCAHEKLPSTEGNIRSLFTDVLSVVDEKIIPVVADRPVINGNDLINAFGLTPGPFVGKVLNELEYAQVCSHKMSRSEALHWIKSYLEKSQ